MEPGRLAVYDILEELLTELVNYAIVGFEFVGVVVLIISGIKGIGNYFTRNPQIRLQLAEGMALSLEFKLGSEILRTVIVRETSELLFVGGIILLRAALTFLIHWEINYEEKQKNQKLHIKDQQLKEEELKLREKEDDSCCGDDREAGNTAPDQETAVPVQAESGDAGHRAERPGKTDLADKILGARFGAEEKRIREKAAEKSKQ
jgi:uncharacterized membrane protein